MDKLKPLFRLLGLCIVLLLIGSRQYAVAQSGDENVWQEPLNLSQSGTAVKPVIVIDPANTFHALWEDTIDGFVYATGDGRSWTNPVPVRLPFSSLSLQGEFIAHASTLLADANEVIHAFWINSEDELRYSRVAAANFSTFESWTPRQTTARKVTVFSVVLDENDHIHLGYLRTTSEANSPAGIYYRRSENGGVTWSDDFLLYQSEYLRALGEGEIQATLNLDATDNAIFLVWDNPLLDKVFFARSIDGGVVWEEPVVIDQREVEDESNAFGPGNINVMAADDEVHLVWRAHHQGKNCGHYHQRSNDEGANWEGRQIVYSDASNCPADNNFLLTTDNLLLLLTRIRNEYYLQAWNGVQWSDPELQQDVTSFTDPVTNKRVSLGCEQVALTNADHLIIVGCSQDDLAQDIWTLARPVGNLLTWFPNLEVRTWSLPDILFQSSLMVKSPIMLTDNQGSSHAFWIETGASDFGTVEDRLYHTRWDGSAWFRPIPVVDLKTGVADQLTAVFLPNGRLLLTWYDPAISAYFLRQVELDGVRIPSDWSSPQPLPVPHERISHPSFFINPNGVIYLTYAVPVNEGRGIYEIHSDDSGATWTEPAIIADAIAKEWLMVDQPFLAQTANGQLHALWVEDDLALDTTAVALHYAHSFDNSQSWEEPALIAEGNIRWNHLAGMGEQGVVIVWQQVSDDEVQLWSRESFDGGVTWERPFLLRGNGESVSFPALTTDLAGQLHLVQLLVDHEGSLTIQEWAKSGDGWDIGENEPLSLNLQQMAIPDIASGIVQDNQLFSIFSNGRIVADEANGLAGESIYFTRREFELLPVIPNTTLTRVVTQLPTPTSTPEIDTSGNEEEIAVVEPDPTNIPAPTTVPLLDDGAATGFFGSASPLVRVGIGIIPVALIIVAFIIWGVRRTNRAR